MPDYIFLMHNDAIVDQRDWATYLHGLREGGFLQGGSAIGNGACIRKSGTPSRITSHVSGFMRIRADDLDHAKALVRGNPVFEAGGTIEIRELPPTD